jgi:dihydrolipoamide dehydrogenase
METHQVVVIGAGPGGYRAAFMAADLGLQVTLIDPQPNPGGVCLYRGCIPTKALLHLAKVKEEAMKASAWGMTFAEPVVDREKVKEWKDSVVKQLTGGLGQLTKARKINYIRGWAKFVDSTTLSVTPVDPACPAGQRCHPGESQDPLAKSSEGGDPGLRRDDSTGDGLRRDDSTGDTMIKFGSVIIATGAVPIKLPFIKEYTARIMDAERALELEFIPERLLVIGGGYIGMESATIYKALGSKVSLVEATPSIMPTMDEELVKIFWKQNTDLFEETLFSTKVTGLEEKKGKVIVTLETMPTDQPITSHQSPITKEYDAVLLSIGMRPNTSTLSLENAGIELDERGFIKADLQGKTNVPNVFAIGDVVGGMLLAHKASYQGRVAAEVIAGQKSIWDARAVPAVVYTDPEIATAGLSEKECQEQGINYRTVKFPWSASGRAVATGDPVGLTKLIVEEGTERILGAGIVGKNAGDLISEAVLGIEMAARVSDIALTIHPHPTVSETIMEAAELYHGTPTHVAAPKRKTP